MVVSRSSAWLSASVLAASAKAYVGYLRQHGYCARVIRAYLHGVGHFARWLTEQLKALDRIDEALVERFLTRHLPICRCASPCKRGVHEVRAALKHLLRVLRHEGRIPGPSVRIPPAIREELERFEAYLDEVCGLALSTRMSRLRWVREFLYKRYGRRALSTYVGHAKVTYTYWYVTGIPELMALAARRFERIARGDSQ